MTVAMAEFVKASVKLSRAYDESTRLLVKFCEELKLDNLTVPGRWMYWLLNRIWDKDRAMLALTDMPGAFVGDFGF